MLKSFQRLGRPLTTCGRVSNPLSSNCARVLNATRLPKSPCFQRNEFCKPVYAACQKYSIHTTSLVFKEQEPDVSSKHQMLIGFTCKVCNERSHHTMSKHSYTKGVVLIQCPGCKNRHLIADNLGWFRDSKTTVEDLVKEKGEAIRKVIVDENGVERLGDLMEWLPEITEEEKIKKDEAKIKAEELKKLQQQKEEEQ